MVVWSQCMHAEQASSRGALGGGGGGATGFLIPDLVTSDFFLT